MKKKDFESLIEAVRINPMTADQLKELKDTILSEQPLAVGMKLWTTDDVYYRVLEAMKGKRIGNPSFAIDATLAFDRQNEALGNALCKESEIEKKALDEAVLNAVEKAQSK